MTDGRQHECQGGLEPEPNDERSVAEAAKNLAEVFGIPEPKGEQLAFLACRFNQAKQEILADIERGVLPKDICDSGDLEQYVEQPGNYGGFNIDHIEGEGARLFPPINDYMGSLVHYQKARIFVSQCIHEWLSSRSEMYGKSGGCK